MASLRDIRTRIGSVKNTKQITSAMKMVSAAKLKRATDAAVRARPYQQTLAATLKRVAAAAGEGVSHPLLTARTDVKKVLVLWIGTDRGLCGGFNANLNRRTLEFVAKLKAEGKTVDVRSWGKKPRDFLKTRHAGATSTVDMTPAKFAATANALADEAAALFTAGAYDEVYLAYNAFKNTLTQVPSVARVLPFALEAGAVADGTEYIYEPSGPEMLAALLPLALRTQVLQAFLETEAGEHAARMTAMDNATRNASDLIAALTLEYNRGRQAAITKELIEIVSGAEAL
jgi:F-type H+-transporting ATPase subunit gamma